MLAPGLLPRSSSPKFVVPAYFNASDLTWIDKLSDTYASQIGKTRRELKMTLAQIEWEGASYRKKKLMQNLLDRIYIGETRLKKPSPKVIRHKAFRIAASQDMENWRRSSIIQKTAKSLKISAAAIERNMFGDLQDEKILSTPQDPPDAGTLLLKGNLATIQGLLSQCEKVRILIHGNARPIIRHGKWRGLICCIREFSGSNGILVEISGPLSVVRRTTVYGKALGELVPYLGTIEKFTLDAKLPDGASHKILRVRTGDPIFPKVGLPKYDSKLEEKFAKSFSKATEDWDLVREPGPYKSGDELVFPDFAIKHRTNPDQFWLLEIVGFWTEEYLRQKLAKYRAAKIDRLIMCIRESLQCSDGQLPSHGEIVRFKTVIQPQRVLEILDSKAIGRDLGVTKSRCCHAVEHHN